MDVEEDVSSVIEKAFYQNCDYFNKDEVDELVTKQETFYFLRAFEWAKMPEFKPVILDTYGDNNCLYYCFLFMLDVTGTTVAGSTSKSMTKTRLKLLRKQMKTYYKDNFLGHDKSSDARNRAHFLDTEDDRLITKLRNRYGEDGYPAIMQTRLYKIEAIWHVEEIYDEKEQYLCKKTPKSSWEEIKSSLTPHELTPPLPDSHFSVKIFARTFDITVVLIVAQRYFKSDDPNDDNFKPNFTFYIYDPAIPNPEIIVSEKFPERLVRDHSIYILSQEAMEVDEDDKTKVFVNYGLWHHKIFLAERILGAKSKREESHNKCKISNRNNILKD